MSDGARLASCSLSLLLCAFAFGVFDTVAFTSSF